MKIKDAVHPIGASVRLFGILCARLRLVFANGSVAGGDRCRVSDAALNTAF